LDEEGDEKVVVVEEYLPWLTLRILLVDIAT